MSDQRERPDKSDLFAVIDPASPRAKFWRNVFLGHAVPILTDKAVGIVVEGEGWGAGPQKAYFLDFARVEPQIRARLIIHLAADWGDPISEVDSELDAKGLPIIAGDDVRVGKDAFELLASFYQAGSGSEVPR